MGKSRKSGFSLTELMIGIGICAVLGLTVFKLVSQAGKNSAIARCRADLRQNAQVAARQLERDISSSRAVPDETDKKKYKMTIVTGDPESEPISSMECPKSEDPEGDATYFDSNEESVNNLYEEVKYTISDKKLYRNAGGKKLKICDNIKSIKFRDDNEIDGIDISYDGKVELKITAKARPDGQPDEIEHVETAIVAIRQLQKKLLDPEKDDKHWKQRVGANDY